MPVLVRVLKFRLRIAAGVNLVLGFMTVLVSVWRRWGQATFSVDDLRLVWTMALASLAGAVLGSLLRKRLAFPVHKWAVCLYLIVIGAWMLYEAYMHAEHVLWNPTGLTRLLAAGGVGFVIAALSGVFGVAGGEMRIPALLYLFAVPIKQAGTLSLLASIPTVAAGAVTDRRIGHLPNSVFVPTAVMAVTSVIGVFIGAAFVSRINTHTTKGLLSAILILATVRMTAMRDGPQSA
jgi:uncharacterized membrane protein YfcA